MINPLVLKVVGILSAITTVVAGGTSIYYLNSWKTINNDQGLASAIIVASSGTVSQTAGGVNEIAVSDYKCQLEGLESSLENCEVALFNVSDSKKQATIDQIISNSSTTPVTNTLLSSANTAFKVKVKDSFLHNYSGNQEKKLQIVKTTDKTFIASLNVLFGVKSDKKLVGKTNTFVAKAKTFTDSSTPAGTSGTSVVLDSSKIFKCHIGATANVASAKTCKLYVFTNESNLSDSESSQLSTFNFSKSIETPETTISKNKYYVVVLEDSYSLDLSTELSDKLFVHVVQGTNSNTEVTTGIKQVEFDDLTPSIISDNTLPFIWTLKKSN